MIILALGSNLGDSVHYLNCAIAHLNRIGKVELVSSIYVTKPWGFVSSHDFYNQVVTSETSLSSLELLRAVKEIEREMGRGAKLTSDYQDRVIDIDIIDYHHEQIKTDELELPHPLFRNRNFVLVPLVEILPQWIDLQTGLTALELLKLSSDKDVPLNLIVESD